MESIFENFDLERFCLGRSVGDIFTCSSRSWGIGMEVFVCAAACRPIPIIGAISKSPTGMLSNHGYAALWKRIRTVAHITAIGGEADQLESYEFDTRPFDSTIELALSALTVQNDGTELTRMQIMAMHALWMFDEALSTGTNLGWCDETIDALVRAMLLAKDVNTEGQKTTGVVDSDIEAAIKAQKREQARRGGLA